ncbi:uncharacterized protein LOC130771650 [Actinidia eriantha]|uniref:uncharacterized protein LOC130771650 n=1 Tax=Actinidia eriantha TaxID=165200 RepID=UPI002586BEF4|nr:uncharacterized protein LOC130771650 [Actinidia eriantha]XP_057485296.1 uncharacterized protein LOC130771650 [Actinidia eriantha]XP_057485297.1 uncharacterized protein LOC130771650 [Actinidia eriantha]
MDHMPLIDKDFDVDLERGGNIYEVGNTDPVLGAKIAKSFSGFVSVDGSSNCEKGLSLCGNISTINDVKLLADKKVEGDATADLVENKKRKERRKTTSAKKPPRPPRPPKALSLDAADQKLIKEISELAMIKRARIERMKALKKMKAEKASISTGNLFAMIFTILFCLVIICQGMCPGRSSPVSFQGSPESAQTAESGFISIQHHRNTSASGTGISGSVSPSLVIR